MPTTGALLAAALGAMLALASVAGHTPLLVGVVLAQGLLLYGWYTVVDVPGRLLGCVLAGGAGLAADVAMRARGDDPSLGPLAGVLGLAAVGAIVHQLARTDGRTRVTASISATLALAALVVLGACLVAERGASHGQTVTVVAVLAAAAATVVAALPWSESVPTAGVEVGAVGAGTLAGALAGAAAGDLRGTHVVLIALAGALLAVVARRAATYAAYDAAQGEATPAPSTRRVATRDARRQGEAVLVLGSALPVVLVAPVAYVLGRLLVG